MSEIAGAINDTVADLFGGGTVDAQTEDTVQVAAPEAEVTTEQPDTPAEPEWDFEAAGRGLFTDDPDDIPDFDAEAAAELGATEQVEDDLAPNEYDDDNTRALKLRLIAERKRSEYHARQHLASSRRAWEADVKAQPWGRFLPEDLSTITATSHRDFNRRAKQIAKTNYEVLRPHFERLAQEQARLREQTTAEVRQEAARAWGKPTVGGTHVPAAVDQPVGGDRLDQAIRSRSMVNVVKEMIDAKII